MSIPAGFPYPLNQVVEIPLEQIIPNPDQPRRSMRQEPLETLAASMKAKGQLTEAKVRPLTEAERAASRKIHPAQQMGDGKLSDSDHLLDPGPWVMLVGGHRRRLAALRNGFKTLKCTVHDITPEDTHYQSLMDNDHEAMDWWDWDIATEKESKIFQGTQDALAARLDKGITKVKVALRITKTLNPAARALVDENLQKTLKNEGRSASSKNKVFLITEDVLLVLASLEDPDQVLAALQVVLDDYLTTDQAQKLVEHMQAGHPIETFNSHRVSTPKKPSGTSNPAESQSPKPGISVPSEPQPAHHVSHPAHLAPTGALALSADTAQASSEEPGNNWLMKMLLGIKFINQIRSKVKKNEPLTPWETCFVWGHAGLKGLGGFLKYLKELLKPAAKTIGHAAKKALGDTLYGLMVLLFRIALIFILVWAVIKVIDYGLVYPWHWVEHKVVSIFHHEDITSPHANGNNNGPLAQPNLAPQLVASAQVPSAPVPVSTPQPAASTVLPKVEAALSHWAPKKKIEKPKPTITYQPAVSFNTSASSSASAPVMTLYDPKILELEIKSLPQNCIVKDYPLTPDEGIPGDVAVSRMQDITDRDKYTLMIGSDKLIVLSVNPTNTTLTINYKSTDLFSVLGGGDGPIHFLWEDVKYIHANEIDIETKNPSVIYQCSLVVSGSKYPLTLQCATAADLEHLVSTMQYFIRASRLAHDTALAGMPYPTQGLWLNNDRVVEKLWADSPADHCGLQLGDHLWSVGKNTPEQQSRKELEAELQSLPVTAFTASPAEWDKAAIATRQSSMSNPIHPRLRKTYLQP